MSNQLIPITNFKTGFDNYDEPENMPNDAFPLLDNALIFRGVLQKRNGNELLGILSVVISAITNANPGAVTTATNHGLTTGDLVNLVDVTGMVEVNFSVEITAITNANPGAVTTAVNHGLTTGDVVTLEDILGMSEVNNESFTVTVTGLTTFTLGADTTTFGVYITPNGNVIKTPFTVTVTGLTTFTLGVDTLAFGVFAGAGRVNILLPVQGLHVRQTVGFLKDLLAFNPTQVFLFNTATNVFDNISGTTAWTGMDTDFFWPLNFQSSFFITNNVDPIRYNIAGSVWTDFEPFLNGTFNTQNFGPIAIGAVAFGPFVVANPPIIQNSIVIRLTGGSTSALNERFTDDGAGNLTGNNGSTGTVVYATGTFNITTLVADLVNPRNLIVTYSQEGTQLNRALMIFAYKDRMMALRTTEGGSEFRQRARFSQNGSVYVDASDPVPPNFTTNGNAWRDDIDGRGDFIDAPTDQAIITAGFVRDVLVVIFEFSAWRLRYTGNETIPFTWERLHSQLGAESTYSVVGFDDGILSVGRAGISITDTNQQKRIDQIIPDQVYQISNVSNAQRRVHGIRDYQRQLVYWTYPSPDSITFPDKTLVYNYVERNWATYTQDFTTFGEFRRDDALVWQDADQQWQEENSFWASGDLAAGFPSVVAGDSTGNVFRLDPTFSSDNGTGFDFQILTKKFNPWIEKGLQSKAIYMYLFIQGTNGGEITIDHFIDEANTGPPIARYTVNTSTNGQEKVWRRIILSGATAQYHQFLFNLSAEQLDDLDISVKPIRIFQIILEMAPSGRLNYGITNV